MTLAPYAARLTLIASAPAGAPYWRELMGQLLATIARRAMAADASLIGHIKAIALTADQCLRANCVASGLPPEVEGELSAPVAQIGLDLAALVYGIDWQSLHEVVAEASAEVCAAMRCTARVDARQPQSGAHRHRDGSSASRPKLIACKVMLDEARAYLPEDMAVEAFDISLHTRPNRLREALQDAIDRSDGLYDPLILAYGMCSRATVGLVARRSRLVIPKSDDCIGIFLGSDEARREEAKREAGTYFLSRGWIGEGPLAEYRHMLERFGKQRADSLLAKMMGHYKRLAYISAPGTEPAPEDRSYARAMAERFGMRYVEIAGSSRLFALMGEMRWEEDFIVTRPGQPIELAHFLT